jgi:hypothetical protein
MKQESTNRSSNAISISKFLSESTYKRVEAGPLVSCIKKTQQPNGDGVRYTFSLEVHRVVRVGKTTTVVSCFDFRPDDIRYFPMLLRNLAEFLVDDGGIDSMLRWDLSNLASCLRDTFRFEEWEDDFFRDGDQELES